MIPFNRPPYTGDEDQYVTTAMHSENISGDGYFTGLVHEWFESRMQSEKVLLTTSCTHALEMAAILIDIQPDDEVIMPSYTFVSTANAFVLRGAKIVFVDIRSDTLNIDETLIEKAITGKTKAIVPVHYAGVSCEMDEIMRIAEKYRLFVIEDAAQGMMSTYKGKPLGTIGHLAAFSFHETKNYSSGGEGGLLLINDAQFVERAEIIREKGTNRSKFFRGEVDKYTWVDIGSSYLPCELNAAYLYGQLVNAEKINDRRMEIWNAYYNGLQSISNAISLPRIPDHCLHNAHMFYILTERLEVRTRLIKYLMEREISSVFHYVPLHTSTEGMKVGRFNGTDKHTTNTSNRLLRLPIYYNLKLFEVHLVIDAIKLFYKQDY